MNYDRVILELLDRVAKLEDEVSNLKQGNPSEIEMKNDESEIKKSFSNTYTYLNYSPSSKKDTTRYVFKGQVFGKNRLVLAVVQEYFKEHPDVSASELILTFDRKIQGSLGVIRELEELKQTNPDYRRRFFVAPNEIIRTATGDCAVCSQWGIGNIGDFIERATQLGYDIQPI